jgi:hypothetical protein
VPYPVLHANLRDLGRVPPRPTTGPMPGSATLGATPRSSRIGSSRSTSDVLTRLSQITCGARPGSSSRYAVASAATFVQPLFIGASSPPGRPSALRNTRSTTGAPNSFCRVTPPHVSICQASTVARRRSSSVQPSSAASRRDNTPASSNHGDKTSCVARRSMTGRGQK